MNMQQTTCYSYGYAEFMNQPQYQDEKPSSQAKFLIVNNFNIS